MDEKDSKNNPLHGGLLKISDKLRRLERKLRRKEKPEDDPDVKTADYSDEQLCRDLSGRIGRLLRLLPGPGRKREQPAPVPAEEAWKATGESVVGLAHRRGTTPLPCQDAHAIGNKSRLILAVCDGAGSAALSELGARRLSEGTVRLLTSLEPLLRALLDQNLTCVTEHILAEMVHRHAAGQLRDLAAEFRRAPGDFKTTLLLFVSGVKFGFWLKVGDGEIVEEKKNRLFRIGTSYKGEYSNETVFIDGQLRFEQVQYGLRDMKNVTGLALMTDGAAERLVSYDGRNIAGRLSDYFQKLRGEKLSREDLYKFFTDPGAWTGTTQDDKTLVLGARKI
ncbi:MAG: protein phosphatase 2C domain-containing protein [Fusobacteriaceae bacterium]|jgi:hypothetical protein|nr:protein phosphatase 2C domain-containing protein [Fusobacteriaceae bacterium]